jgi:transporter family-2 protein
MEARAMNNLFLLLAAVAGAGVTIQAIVNARLGAAFGAPIWGAMTQFVVGLTILLLVVAVTRQPAPNTSSVGQRPWWLWTGGLFGALFIFATVYLTPKFGAALTMSCAILGQLTAAMLIDHFGWFGASVVRMNGTRAAGAVLLAAGVILMRWR